MPAIEGVRFATAEAGIKYKNRTDLLVMVFDEGTRRPASSPGRNARRRRSTCAAQTSRAARRGRWSSIPATPTPSPARRAARSTRMTAEAAAKAAGCASRRGVPRLDRRHRRAARCRPKFASCSPTWLQGGEAGPLDRGRQGDHDHRHLSESSDRDGQARRRRCHHQRHRQGRRHDRARHGDDALLRRHRCADRRARAAGSAVASGTAKTFNAVTVDSDTSTSDTLLLFATGLRQARRAAHRRHQGCAPRRRSSGRSTGC